MSSATKVTVSAVSSVVLAETLLAVGASFTGVTFTVTRPVSVLPKLSVT